MREVLAEPVRVTQPLPPAELAGRTARRAAAASGRVNLLPAEFSTRYHQQFVDRLWLRGLVAAGILYAIGVVIYFCATAFLAMQTHKVEQQVAAISGSYTNAIQLKARYGVLKETAGIESTPRWNAGKSSPKNCPKASRCSGSASPMGANFHSTGLASRTRLA